MRLDNFLTLPGARPVLSWEPGAGKSYSIPAAEIIGFDFLLNQFDRHFIDADEYGSNFSTFRHNLTHKWVVDNDPFATNQFLHPYQGSMYHGFARSSGLNNWESLGYAFAGSVLWEAAGETTPPSINDQIASGIGGTFLGEPLFRMASLLWRKEARCRDSGASWERRRSRHPRASTALCSATGSMPCCRAATRRSTGIQLGGSWTAHNGLGASQSVTQSEAIANLALAYGLPGKRDYSYTRPFDYFNFEFTASSANIFENIMARGLLVGTRYGAGEAYRGVWGLYGSYDYIAPQIFRISSTALSLGTTAQWWLSKTVALQGTALAGVGYGAGGTIHGLGERDYHYGLTPQGLPALRLIFGDAASLDLSGRDYYVSRVASTESRGRENIARAEVSFTWRLYRRHAITLKFVASFRDARYPDLGDRSQDLGTVSVLYTLLDDTFGSGPSSGATRTPAAAEQRIETPSLSLPRTQSKIAKSFTRGSKLTVIVWHFLGAGPPAGVTALGQPRHPIALRQCLVDSRPQSVVMAV